MDDPQEPRTPDDLPGRGQAASRAPADPSRMPVDPFRAPVDPPPLPTGLQLPGAPLPGEGYGAPRTVRRTGLGTPALVAGVLALLLCWTVVPGGALGLLALGLGVVGRGRVRRGEADDGRAALAGAVLGVVALLVAAGLAAFLASDTGADLRGCLEQAQGDRDAQDDCRRDLQERLREGRS